MKKIIFLTVALLLSFAKGYSDHLIGADITYQNKGKNKYLITLSVYRYCNDVPYRFSYSVNYSSLSCKNPGGTITVNAVDKEGIEISPICPTQVSSCDPKRGPNAPAGIKKYVFTGEVVLPESCSDWTFSFNEANEKRNSFISTIENPKDQNLYIEAKVNTIAAPSNNSPLFKDPPVAFLKIGQHNQLSPGTTEADGDKLLFKIVTPRSGIATPVKYKTPYSASNPVISSDGLNFDPNTGAINVSPSKEEISITAIVVEEYNQNGILVGSVMRDMQLITMNMSNNLPSISGIDGQPGNKSVTICSGQEICFSLSAEDPDKQLVNLNWNEGITGAKFDIEENDIEKPQAKFCWTPNLSQSGTFSFTVTAKDFNCPTRGITIETYTINVTPSPVIKMPASRQVACKEQVEIIPVISGGVAPYTYKWNTGKTTPTENHIEGSASYAVTVKSAGEQQCSTNSDTVKFTSTIFANFSNTTICQAKDIDFIDISKTTGAIINSWSWDFGDPNSGSQNKSTMKNPSHKYNAPGMYAVTLNIKDDKGCNASVIRDVKVCDIPVVNFDFLDSCKQKDIQFQDLVKVQYCGIKRYTITENGRVAWDEYFPSIRHKEGFYSPPTQNLHFPVFPKDTGMVEFSVTVVNEYGCISSLTKKYHVNDNPFIDIQEDDIYLKCSNPDTNFTYIDLPQEGRPPYTIIWTDSTTGKTFSGKTLKVDTVGVYSVKITDALGCDTTAVRKVIYPVKTDYRYSRYCNSKDSRTFIDSTVSHYKINEWNWKMGNESVVIKTDSAERNIKYNFTKNGTYNVLLTVTDEGGCKDTTMYKVSQSEPDTSLFTITPVHICQDKPMPGMKFMSPRGATIDTIAWNYFGIKDKYDTKRPRRFLSSKDGMYYYDISKNPYEYDSTGKIREFHPYVRVVYNADTLVVNTNPKEKFKGCVLVLNDTVTIYPKTQISTEVTGSCLGSETKFRAAEIPGISYRWNIYQREKHTTGEHTHILDSSFSNTGSITLPSAGIYLFELVANDKNDCPAGTAKDLQVITFPKPQICDRLYCAKRNMPFSVSDTCTLYPEGMPLLGHWDFGDPSSPTNLSTGATTFHVYEKEGDYTIKLKTVHMELGCSAENTFNVLVRPNPKPDFTASSPVCLGHPVVFTDNSKSAGDDIIKIRTWKYGNGDSSNFLQESTHNYLYKNTGTYTAQLYIEGQSGCWDTTASTVITVGPTPTAGFEYDENELLKGKAVKFTNTSSPDGVKWYWNYGDGREEIITDSLLKDPIKTFSVDSTYITQIVFNSFGCSDTLVKYIDLKAYLLLPTAFTPNKDNSNEVLTLVYKGIQELLEFRIYNRWGELVFDGAQNKEIERASISWDGTYKGREQPAGTYVWYVKAKSFTGYEYSNSGKVTLIR